jgi:hypothetical protein
MKTRLLAAALVLFAAPFAVAADEENPYKKAKVGDFATYKMTTKVAGLNIEGTVTQTVIAKDDKEVTIKTTGSAGDMEFPAQEQKIDLTKPFDPTKAGKLPAGADVKVDKQKDGTEKLKVAGKEYSTKWETYKLQMKQMGVEFGADMKIWQTKDLNIPVVKMEMSADLGGNKMEVVMELTETGNKEPEKSKDKDK